MPCCPSTSIVFVDQPTSTIYYSPLMQSQYGPTPRIYIWYRDTGTGKYLQSSFFTFQSFDPVGDQIVIDHGGASTGFIVIR